MRTPSHFLMTAAMNTIVPEEKRHTYALLVGSVLPDIPFTILTIIYGIYYQFWGTIPNNQTTMEYLHFNLFFNDSVWIVSHNFFHSLVIGISLLTIGYINWQRRWGKWLTWLSFGALFHTLIDIFTHHSDGPLFLFPLNWSYRFASPISYWETEYFGQQFRIFEYLLGFILLIYLIIRWWRKNESN